MADFRRRLPDWQQSADRHSQLTDPVITVRQLSRLDFTTRKPPTRIDHALVFATAQGGYETYLPPLRPTRSEAAGKRYTAVYEVDMGVHPVSAALALPSDNDAFEFGVAVELSWQVVDPARFVASGHRNVPGLLIGELQQAARPVARRFPIARSADAEQELLRTLTMGAPLGETAGLRVTWTVRLRRDDENIAHQQRLQAIDHAATEGVRTAQRGMELDVEQDRRSRQQDALQIERASQYGRQEQELALQQQQWQHERALQRGRQELELQQLETEKIKFYQWHLEQRGVQSWAMHLARHPEDTELVMNNMREDQLRFIQAQMDLVGQLLGGDHAEGYELEGPKQLALRAMSDILSQRLPGVSPPDSGGGPASPPSPPSPPSLDKSPASAGGTADAADTADRADTASQQRQRQEAAAPPAAPNSPGTLDGWQPPPGYGSTPVMPPPPPGPPPPPPAATGNEQPDGEGPNSQGPHSEGPTDEGPNPS
ncbi:hypothetical protein [Streptomyces sp. NPDC002851]